MDERIMEIATRIYEAMDPWERFDTSIEETAEEIMKNPIDCIEYLLSIVENN